MLKAQAPIINENFDEITTSGSPATGALPSGWTTGANSAFKVYGIENLHPHGDSPNNACSVEMNSSHTADTLIMPAISPIDANTKMSLAYRFVNKASYPNTGYQLVSGDQISIDAYIGTSWTNVATINSTTNPTPLNTYTTYTYACSACGSLAGFGITSIKIRMDVARATSATSDWYLDIDNVIVGDNIAGIEYNALNPPALLVYPNPNNGNFTVWLKNYQANNPVEVSVYNYLGQKVKTVSAEGAVNNQVNVSSLGLDKGMYLVEVKSGTEVAKSKIQID